MPYAFDLGAAIGDDAAEHRQRPRVEAAIVRHIHVGLKPELGFSPVLKNVDMNRLERIAFVGVEEEPVAVVAEDGGHYMLFLLLPFDAEAVKYDDSL